MLYQYKYYMVEGFQIKYTLFTDALNKAVQCYPGRAQSKIKTCYAVTENKSTANKYEIIGEVE